MKKILTALFITLIITACELSLDGSSGGETAQNGPRGGQGSNPAPGVTVNAYEKEILDLVNKHRSDRRKKTLKWHDQAIIEAQEHSQDMAAFRLPLGHIGSSARYARIRANDPDNISRTGENVAKNSNAQKAFNAWLFSPGHRRNIEGDYTHTGIGAVKSANGSWYFTQIFLKK